MHASLLLSLTESAPQAQAAMPALGFVQPEMPEHVAGITLCPGTVHVLGHAKHLADALRPTPYLPREHSMQAVPFQLVPVSQHPGVGPASQLVLARNTATVFSAWVTAMRS
jgi:hypothetical protein